MQKKKVADGIYYHSYYDRLMEHNGYATRIYWSQDMIDILKRYYPIEKNEVVAGLCGVSIRTMIRKSRELGLRKNKDFLRQVWNENRKLAHLVNKVKVNSGMIKKGHIPWNKGLKIK